MAGLLKRAVIKQFMKFCLIGVTITVFSYLIFLILFYFLGIHYAFSSGAGFMGGVLLGFLFNKVYTFESKRKPRHEIIQYFLIYTFTLIFTVAAISFMVEYLFFNPIVANLILQPLIVLINFFGTKVIVFKNKEW